MKMFLAFLMTLFCLVTANAAISNESNPNLSVIDLGSITANGDVYGLYLPPRAKILGAYVVDGTGIAADDTNYVQLQLMNGSTQLAELDSRAAHENGLAANVPKAMNVVTANQLVAAGSYLKVNYVEAGTVGMASAKVFVYWSVQ